MSLKPPETTETRTGKYLDMLDPEDGKAVRGEIVIAQDGTLKVRDPFLTEADRVEMVEAAAPTNIQRRHDE